MKTVLKPDPKYDLSSQHLKEGSIFGALSDISIEYLLTHGKIHSLQQGEEVFHYGSKGESFFIILAGSLDFYKQHDDQAALTRQIEFGEAVGYVSMIALHNRVGKAVAKEESLLLEISSQLFSDLHDHYPFDFGILLMNLSRDMARTIRALSNALVKSSAG